MPETPEELYERAKNALRMPPVEEWETFPFDGALRPRPLQPPTEEERPRLGAGGVDCRRCAASDDEYFWTSERWRLCVLGPTGLPLSVMLEPREHFAETGDLPDELAAELGMLLAPYRCSYKRASEPKVARSSPTTLPTTTRPKPSRIL